MEDADEERPELARRETGEDDADPGKTAGFRTHGKSKDSRDDLPQIVIGMAVTRDGIPVRVWCWPGNTTDSALIRQVKTDMRDWVLGKVIWVADRGFSSAQPPVPAAGRRRVHHRGETPEPSPRWSRPRCPGRAATGRPPGTCRSRKSASPTRPTGS